MSHQYQGAVCLLHIAADKLFREHGSLHIHGGSGLIQDDKLKAFHHKSAGSHAGGFTAGETVARLIGKLGNSQRLHKLCGALLIIAAKHDVFLRAHAEGIVFLGHIAKLCIAAVCFFICPDNPGKDFGKGGLAAAVCADDGVYFTGFKFSTGEIKHTALVVVFAESIDFHRLSLLCSREMATLTTRDRLRRMMPKAMPRVKSPLLVYCMIAVVITMVFHDMAPPTMLTAPTSAMEREKARR